jgi:hypothetical protein
MRREGVNPGTGIMSTVMSDLRREIVKEKGNRNFAIPLIFLVAGPGFEPETFGYERRKIVRNLLIIKRKKKRIEDLGQKYSSMILMGCEGL